MRSSVLLTLASGLLTYALPTTPDTSLIAVNATLQWMPDPPYPPGFSPAICPLGPGPNPWSTLEAPEGKERSLTTATHLRRRNVICRQIAHRNLYNFQRMVGEMQDVLLVAGFAYVFSWSMTKPIFWVSAWRRKHDGTYTIIQHEEFNEDWAGMTLIIDKTAPVRFTFFFKHTDDVTGKFALFQLGPGQDP